MTFTTLPLGWIDFEERTDAQNEIHQGIVAQMPAFNLVTGKPPVGTKVLLTDLWKKQAVIDNLGYAFPGWYQFTGSCVGVGGGNTMQTVNFVDSFIRKEPEKIVLIAWPYNYGRSRQLGGMNGQGEGSFGSTFAKSAGLDGGSDWIASLGLPTVKLDGQLIIGKSAELQWSDGNKASQDLRSEAKPHKFVTAPLSRAEQVRDAIVNGYPCTRAFSAYVNPNTGRVKGDVLVGSYNGRGGHQESWLGYWNHPQQGELIFEMNQWGKSIYGVDPGGGAPGGIWIPIDEVDRMCQSRYAEIYAWSSYEGYPAQPQVIDWDRQSFWS